MSAAEFVRAFSHGIGLLVTVLYAYQALYLIVGLVQRVRREKRGQPRLRRYAALISARNEAGVIGELIHSLKRQNYPADLLDIYVVADNCTDLTAAVAQAAGARVYRRTDRVRVGKGYALDFLLKKLAEDGLDTYDGYLIFDADNLVDPNFVAEMDRTFDPARHAAVTGYRNSKNFGQNWISAGYSIWFLREARFVNAARQALGLSCAVSGTGFLISGAYLRAQGGWPYHLLTEDIQFSAHCVSRGLKIGYCPGAVIYDEQPTSLRQSWDQRLRWSKGFYQVAGRYGGALLRGMAKGGRQALSCYDMLLTVSPGVLLTVLGGGANLVVALSCLGASGLAARAALLAFLAFLGRGFASFYIGMFLYGLITVLSEWRYIRARSWQKLIYLVAFPLFMATYIPVSIAALFQKVEWKPIRHTARAELDLAA